MPLFKGKSSKAKPKKAIDYITDPKKAVIVSSLSMDDNENYAKQFKQTCDLFGKGSKNNERKYYHFKLSIDPNDNPAPEQSHKLAEKLAQELFSAHECVIATHNDTDTLHSHIIINAASFETGKKLHLNDSAYRNCKDLAEKLGAEMGFTPLMWREKTSAKRQRDKNDTSLESKSLTNAERNIAKRDFDGTASWKDALRHAIDEAKANTASRAEFQNYLYENFGVIMPRNTAKTVSFVHPAVGETKAVRGMKLGGLYTASSIDEALLNNKNYNDRSVFNEGLFTQTEQPPTGASHGNSNWTDPTTVTHAPIPTTIHQPSRPFEPTSPSQRTSQERSRNRFAPRSISDISADLQRINESVYGIAMDNQQQYDDECGVVATIGGGDTIGFEPEFVGAAEHNEPERPAPTKPTPEPPKPEPNIPEKPKRRAKGHDR